MGAISSAERITESFYAWEIRGRGWQLADYPVSLEPPHRPFFLMPGVAGTLPERIDDGRRPTLLTQFIEETRKLFFPAPHDVGEPFAEQPPFPALPRSSLVTFAVRLPPDFAAKLAAAEPLLLALSSTLHPVSWEWIGAEGTVSLQIACDEDDADRVLSAVSGYAPEATIVEEDDRLYEHWDVRSPHIIADIGLANEFFLPLASARSFSVDPYIALVAALAQAGRGECALLQVLFERVRNPWADTISDALCDGEGDCIFADAPQFPPLAQEKTETTLFASVVRIAVSARTEAAVRDLTRGAGSFLLQFARPGCNELVPLENDGYPDALHEAALRDRTSYRTGMLLSARELIGLVHLPDASVRHPALSRETKRTKAAPAEARKRGIVLGANMHRGERAVVSLESGERLQHVHIVGATGTGKSTLLINLALQDIAAGSGVAVLDPHGDLIDDIVARIPSECRDEVILFDPSDEKYPIGFNILCASSDRERTLLASDLVGVFERLATSWGDTMSTVLGNAVLAILESTRGGTLLDLRRFLIDEGFRRTYLTTIADPDVRFFWEREYALIGTRSIGPILTRLDAFLRPKLVRAIVGQQEARLDFSAVMDGGKIFLAKLSQGMIGEVNAALLGSLLVSKFHQLALGRQAQGKSARRAFFLYADECQHFVTLSMGALLTEGRKYGLGLTLAHQGLAQLDHAGPVLRSAILGVHTRIVFRVGHDDARVLAGGYSFFEADDLLRLGKGEAIARVGSSANDFNLHTFPAEEVDEDTADERQRRVTEHSREVYAVPLAELRARWAKVERRDDEPPPVAASPPESPKDETPAEEVRAEEHVSAPTEIPSRAPKTPRTVAAPAVEPAPLGRGGAEHKYLQHLIKRLAEERGFRAVIEEPVQDGRVDVVLRKDAIAVACEVSITTDMHYEIENLKKCLGAGFTRIIFVSPDKKRRQKISTWITEETTATAIDAIAPDEIVATLDGLHTGHAAVETTVRGYKVKVTRQALSPEELTGKRSAIAGVIARSLDLTGKQRT